MEKITEQYAKFVTDVGWDSLPENVVHEVKRVLLDSVGCAILGLVTDKAKLAVELMVRQGGTPEATILGLGARVPAASAALANAEMVNSMDYDASLNGHVPPIVVPAALAVAEYTRARGRDLIVALALGLEAGARMKQAFPRHGELVREGPDTGKTREWPASGYGDTVFGATAAASKLLGLDMERTLNALGIAGYIAPVPCTRKFGKTPITSMTKYCMMGWVAHAGVTAASLAELGYTGDQTVLDGDYGFWRFYLPYKWAPELLFDGLGKEWYVPKAFYKPYPCCREWHTLLDCFTHIIEANKLAPEDIEQVRLFARKETFQNPVWINREIRSQTDAQMSAPYAIAVAAHRVKVTDWQDFDTIRNPSILAFMDKVKLEAYPEWTKLALETPGSDPAAVEVVAQGQVFREERKFGKGGARIKSVGRTTTASIAVPQDIRMSDAELVKKFSANVSRVLPQHKADRFVESVFKLEEAPDVAELVALAKI
ncbi:MAG: MmgE/PrpD family protein [Chloroflexi bacterium]|nr:MmgE/PrpD family protein [Chloroflexota bacterium]